jgi:hypothetical protein
VCVLIIQKTVQEIVVRNSDAREKKTRFSELRPTGSSPGKKVRRIELSEDASRDIGFTQSGWGHFKLVVEEYG